MKKSQLKSIIKLILQEITLSGDDAIDRQIINGEKQKAAIDIRNISRLKTGITKVKKQKEKLDKELSKEKESSLEDNK